MIGEISYRKCKKGWKRLEFNSSSAARNVAEREIGPVLIATIDEIVGRAIVKYSSVNCESVLHPLQPRSFTNCSIGTWITYKRAFFLTVVYFRHSSERCEIWRKRKQWTRVMEVIVSCRNLNWKEATSWAKGGVNHFTRPHKIVHHKA